MKIECDVLLRELWRDLSQRGDGTQGYASRHTPLVIPDLNMESGLLYSDSPKTNVRLWRLFRGT